MLLKSYHGEIFPYVRRTSSKGKNQWFCKHFISVNLMKKMKHLNNLNLYDKISPAVEVDFYRGPEEYLVSINSKKE